ncbi:MAG: type II methionyl aminopeptidase [Candidatus Freyarchaeota archaeon]|nr:type II methionyl aminopeptidase [Candidatus Jordarchaeia archaeon]
MASEKRGDEEAQADALGRHRHAGKVAKEVKEAIRGLVRPGVKCIDICETVERLIIEKGGRPAFPCNVSINNVAAHYTSPPGDSLTINEGDVVKVDFGVHVEGYIADTALTFCMNKEAERLAEAAREALKNAIELIAPGVETNVVGREIEKVIRDYGYRPLRELSGHILEQYVLHGSKVIPNVALPHGETINKGEVYAVEIFASTGSGGVSEAPYAYIFSLQPFFAPLRLKEARKIVMVVEKEYRTLPFAERWLATCFSRGKLRVALRELVSKGVLRQYRVLSDRKGSYVAQAEETVIVADDGCEVIT